MGPAVQMPIPNKPVRPIFLAVALLGFALSGLAACRVPHGIGETAMEQLKANEGYLFHAEASLQDDWFHMPIRGETDYRLVVFDGQVAIRAQGRDSASGLMRHVAFDPIRCPDLEWSWAVTKLQRDARLAVKAKEDVAASLFLMFGDPGSLLQPEPVPTLRYVWTNDSEQAETIVDSPYLSGVVRSLVVRTGNSAGHAWAVERRNIVADFERAFGRPPEEEIETIALFTDNDQTKQPVEAYYGWARVRCLSGAGPIEEPAWD